MHNEPKDLKKCLIEAGFWGTDDEGDLATDVEAVELVIGRMQERLAEDVSLLFYAPEVAHPEHEARLEWAGGRQTLASGVSIGDAICNAALALSDFLKQHPDCAAPTE
jgi:hypothetical protein